MDKSLKIALGSLAVSIVVLAVKFTAYLKAEYISAVVIGALVTAAPAKPPSSILIWRLQEIWRCCGLMKSATG